MTVFVVVTMDAGHAGRIGRRDPARQARCRIYQVLSYNPKDIEERVMATCPECDAEIEVDEFDVDKGDLISCPDCGSNLEVTSITPVELEAVEEDEDEDEDDDEDGADDDEFDDVDDVDDVDEDDTAGEDYE
jgi:alpha-aminoadipate carrier protein LysW